jgi:hypothetical protein
MISTQNKLYFHRFLLLFAVLIGSGNTSLSAQVAFVRGVIKGTDGTALEQINVAVREKPTQVVYSGEDGSYTIEIEANKLQHIIYFDISHTEHTFTVIASEGQIVNHPVIMAFKNNLIQVDVTSSTRGSEIVVLDPRIIQRMPTIGQNVEDIIKTQMGVSSNNELSSGYSVRGGNYDENLVYVNDIEVYRPFLVRSGQQEGLSFANPNMVQSLSFSAGGFEAKYGDKLSSVLDITYRKPHKFAGTASASFLGGNVQMEGVSKNKLVAWNIGGRYRTNIYLLKGLDTKGEYRPSSMDVQSFLTFDINPKFKLEFLGNINNNRYLVIPSNRTTDFGTVQNALRFTVYFDGQELMQYTTFMAGLSGTYKPRSNTKLKFITSAYRANEQEIYTIQGQYYIDQLEADLGKPNFGQVAFNRGVGTFLNNGRNYLNATVINFEHKGTHDFDRDNQLLWGARQQFETIKDRLSEWKTVDSAGFNVPYSPDAVILSDVYKTKIGLASGRSQAYVQYNFSRVLKDTSNLKITAGVRANYWTVNQQTVFSPRVTFAYEPNWKRDWLFRLSGGFYYQPPFYRELRNIDGTINTNIKAQRSIHVVLSSDYNFSMWNRPFKLVMATYWKDLSSVIPYEIDNVRIRYFANNNTKAYATGADIRINGEFVSGVESWATIGVLRTYEYSKDNIHYVYYNKAGEQITRGITFDQVHADSTKIDPGYIPRPTDQMVTFGMFFQDHLPAYPAIKFNLNLQFGSGLPFGPPTHHRWQQLLRMPPYRRADAGMAYNVLKPERKHIRKNMFNNLDEMWIYLEVFNLLQIQNTVSYTWVTDVTGNKYAIPNYLTNRQVNLRLQVKF